MAVDDRDWYWQRRKAKAGPDDDHLFPDHRWPNEKRARTIVLIACSLLAVLLLLGWLGGVTGPSRADRIAAERRAIERYDAGRTPGQTLTIPQSSSRVPVPARATPEEIAARQWRDGVIQMVLLGLALVAPVLCVAMLIALFFRVARGPAAAGLVCGFLGGHAGAAAHYANWLLPAADSMGNVAKFFIFIAAFSTVGALIGIVVTRVLLKRRAFIPARG
jgi:hypothetical protein